MYYVDYWLFWVWKTLNGLITNESIDSAYVQFLASGEDLNFMWTASRRWLTLTFRSGQYLCCKRTQITVVLNVSDW